MAMAMAVVIAMATTITNGPCRLVKIRDSGAHGLLEWQRWI